MRPATFESTESFDQREFEEWVRALGPADENRYELLNGRIVMTPPAGYPHGESGAGVVEALRQFVRKRRLGRVFDSSQGFELPSGDTVEPDASFVSHERWGAAPAPEEGKSLRVVPDLVAEVLSTQTASRDRGEKKAIYERNGVREYWLVDPRRREVTRFVLDGPRLDRGTVFSEEEEARSELLSGLSVPVRDLLPEPP